MVISLELGANDFDVVCCRFSVQLAAVRRGTNRHRDDTWHTWAIGLLRDVIV